MKCITHYMGGGFGSKFGPDVQGIAAADLARRAGAPVKLMLDREEEITTAGNRPSAYGTVKIAGNEGRQHHRLRGRLPRHLRVTGGATVNLGLLPYVYLDAIPNCKRTHSVAFINAGAARAMRAPGHPQNCVLTEFAVDDLAAKLGIDPLQVRRKNLPPNDDDGEGARTRSSCAARRQRRSTTSRLDIAAQAVRLEGEVAPAGQGAGQGRRQARHRHGPAHLGRLRPAAQPNECTVTIGKDGSVTAETSTQDLGTAQRTVTAIVAAEILGLQPTDIIVKLGESQYGCSSGSGGSTTCPSQAPATLLAAAGGPRRPVRQGRRRRSGPSRRTWRSRPARSSTRRPSKEWPWKEVCARLGMDEAKGKGEWSLALSNEPGNEQHLQRSGRRRADRRGAGRYRDRRGALHAHRRGAGLRPGRQQAGVRVAGGRRRHHGRSTTPCSRSASWTATPAGRSTRTWSSTSSAASTTCRRSSST